MGLGLKVRYNYTPEVTRSYLQGRFYPLYVCRKKQKRKQNIHYLFIFIFILAFQISILKYMMYY